MQVSFGLLDYYIIQVGFGLLDFIEKDSIIICRVEVNLNYFNTIPFVIIRVTMRLKAGILNLDLPCHFIVVNSFLRINNLNFI